MSFYDLAQMYSGMLLDAYGVIVNEWGLCKDAKERIEFLGKLGKPFLVVTNDASRSAQTAALRLSQLGLRISSSQVITSGMLLKDYFTENHLAGARCGVLGTRDTESYVRDAGGEIVPLSNSAEYEVVVLGDQSGYDFLETTSYLLSSLFRLFEKGTPPRLILPNPDIIFPISSKSFGLAVGSIALVIERALDVRFGASGQHKFHPLGKPHSPIFKKAINTIGTNHVVMVGDTLATDILGANDFGIASALVVEGGSSVHQQHDNNAIEPTFLVI